MSTKFEEGKYYGPEHKTIFGSSNFKIIKRTDKTITYESGFEHKVKIRYDEEGNEYFIHKGYPFSQNITSKKTFDRR